VAAFTGSPMTGTAPLNSTFNSTSTGSITSYAWTFGDGGTATTANPSHTYNNAGTYTVTLAVTGPGGTNSTTKAVTVSAAPAVTVDFSATTTTGTAPLAVSFTATASAGLTSFTWDFGDGATGLGGAVSHVYAAAGSYTVAVTASGTAGSKYVTKPDYVKVNGALAADFSANRMAGAVPLRVTFSETSSGTVATHLWNFGDGSTSSEAQPVHTYRMPGSFTVTLTVTGPAGTKTETKSAYVNAVAANDLVADFGADSGIWSFKNGSVWRRMDTRSARQIVMTDVDHNGDSDVLVDLGADSLGASLGTWRLSKDGLWTALDSRTAKTIVSGDFDGNGQDDQVFDFGSGKGIWLLLNGTAWSQIDQRTAKSLLLADLDRDGRDELIADFGASVGIWSYSATAGWTQIDSRSATWMIAADLDGNDQTDLVADFGPGTGAWGSPNGVWARLNESTWFQIDPRTADRGAAVNPDGNRKEELALHYSGDGIYLYSHTTPVGTNLTSYVASNWLKISSQGPTRMIAADLDSDGKQDLVVDFGAGNSNGLWKYSSGSWTKINKKTTNGMVSGQFR
jgi:PKD repeat protein